MSIINDVVAFVLYYSDQEEWLKQHNLKCIGSSDSQKPNTKVEVTQSVK